jgi:CRISPR-associated endonuclease/helicase Cas3
MESYFRYWGKVGKGKETYHLLPYHCLDVAAVGWVLLDPKRQLYWRTALRLGVLPELLQCWFAFFLSLHDIGKFATAFQGLVPGLSPRLVPASSRMHYTERHDSLGFLLWLDVLTGRLEAEEGFGNCLPGAASRRIRRILNLWLKIVTGHHGVPPKCTSVNLANHFTKTDEDAAFEYLRTVSGLFLLSSEAALMFEESLYQRLKSASWMLAGLAVLADWLGSSRNPEEYLPSEMPLGDYWQGYALPFAERTVHKAALEPSTVAPYRNTANLFEFVSSLTPLQQWAESCEIPSANQLFILEDVTGAGKTEAAITLAHRLMAGGLAEGLYVALPTMATANAMYERLGKGYRRLYAKEALPSLALAHGARHLSADFRRSFGLPQSSNSSPEYGRQDETAETYCSAWFADSRKKALLAEVGVGTLDQALLAVLPARHQSLRCLGLARKVMIVDEVHSYDPYMNHLLQSLLEYHASQGGSAILLSATLPYAMRVKYLEAFCRGTGTEPPVLERIEEYPLATHFPSSNQTEIPLLTRVEVQRSLSVVLLDDIAKVVNLAKDAVEQGRCVCWVRNTVGDAINAFLLLSKQEWMRQDRLSLFHSRFAMIDRQRIESETLERFGKDSSARMRNGRVLVATQVVEQSLDLDFDLMISDLAPIDLLLQRAGREHRHVRDPEGNRLYESGAVDRRGAPVFYIFGPQVTSSPEGNWLKDVLPGTQAVYQHVGQLWLTQQLLAGIGTVMIPGDARRLIEGVYGDSAQEIIPPSLLELTWKAIGEASGKLSMANLNVLKLSKGYSRASSDGGGWEEESKIPTRLGDDSIRVALVTPRGDNWRPYADVQEFPWDLSMLNVPRWRWTEALEAIPAGVRSSLDRFKEENRILKWVELFPMLPDLAAWYSDKLGWGIQKEDADEPD